ncbi:hypothetical protein HOLleu_06530 [Holothuria leucospilota]|uniref:Uncharacterized protein n=1 Tax=Holothuria leucospilota TaxID=206669 RepID=A0A9Q1CN73_HOLLE|nr:hypothetical protein HOLleu_06530 [Holothuria leucospilota]
MLCWMYTLYPLYLGRRSRQASKLFPISNRVPLPIKFKMESSHNNVLVPTDDEVFLKRGVITTKYLPNPLIGIAFYISIAFI